MADVSAPSSRLLRPLLWALTLLAFACAFIGYTQFARVGRLLYPTQVFDHSEYDFPERVYNALFYMPMYFTSNYLMAPLDTYPPAIKSQLETMRGASNNVTALLANWNAHRSAPDARVYYGYYALYLTPESTQDAYPKELTASPLPEKPPVPPFTHPSPKVALATTDLAERYTEPLKGKYIAVLRQGERIDPDNALYNLRLAEHYLRAGVISHQSYVSKDKIDYLVNQQAMEMGLAELRKAVKKPHLRYYQAEMLRKRFSVLPKAQDTEDYIYRAGLAADILLPYLSQQRQMGRDLDAVVRILYAEGRAVEAEEVINLWKPLYRLRIDGAELQIDQMIASALGEISTKDYAAILEEQGENGKAKALRAEGKRVTTPVQSLWRLPNGRPIPIPIDWSPAKPVNRMIGDYGPLFPIGILDAHTAQYVTKAGLAPMRTNEQTMQELAAAGCVLLIFGLALLWTLAQGGWAWFLTRKQELHPRVWLLDRRTWLRILLLGVALPLLVYLVESRLPVIGGREHGFWNPTAFLRFFGEQTVLAALLIILPGVLAARAVRQHWMAEGLPLPGKERAHKVLLAVLWVIWTGASFGAIAFVANYISAHDEIDYETLRTETLQPMLPLVIAVCVYVILTRLYRIFLRTRLRFFSPVIADMLLALMVITGFSLAIGDFDWVLNPLRFNAENPLWLVIGVLLVLGISAAALLPLFRTHGAYYGTLARSLVPVYAIVLVMLTLVTIPTLRYRERACLAQDHLLLMKDDCIGPGHTLGFAPIDVNLFHDLRAETLRLIDSAK